MQHQDQVDGAMAANEEIDELMIDFEFDYDDNGKKVCHGNLFSIVPINFCQILYECFIILLNFVVRRYWVKDRLE